VATLKEPPSFGVILRVRECSHHVRNRLRLTPEALKDVYGLAWEHRDK
jgi:hypothetical protein